jgi:plastocyanin
VVPGLLGGRGRALTLLLAVACLFLALPAAAGAVNTRVSISNFAWSKPAVGIDLGERVTWDWLGPDLAHSVTGASPNAVRWDSDPHTDGPSHQPGDSFTIQFEQPGTYAFQCKLHSFVRGEVVVSSTPGNPNSDPGPQAPLNIDVAKPTLGEVRLAKRRFSSRKGVRTSAAINERGTVDAEYYRFNSKGKRVYNGFETWKAFIGQNRLMVGARGEHFKGRPGRYLVVLQATDLANNVSKVVKKRFQILA